MLYDRPYMRASADPSARTWLKPIMITLVAVYALVRIVGAFSGSGAESGWLSQLLLLNGYGLTRGQVWRLATYALLHAGLLHLGLNLLGLWLLGRYLESEMGGRRLFEVFLAGIIMGGIFFATLHWGSGASVIGASAGVTAVFAAWARLRWFDRAMLLPFPVELPVRWLFWGILGINAFSLLVEELPTRGASGVASSAHLGGLCAGWLWATWRTAAAGRSRRLIIEPPAWLRRRRQHRQPAPQFHIDLHSPSDLRAEVDRILDKINAEGFGSLSADERATLDKARDVLRS